MRAAYVGSVVAFISIGLTTWGAGCGGGTNGSGGDAGAANGSGSGGGLGGSGGNLIVTPDASSRCVNGTQCAAQCSSGSQTKITGTVYDPAGNNPLPYVVVYVPHDVPLTKLKDGAHCPDCQGLFTNTVLASAITDFDGTFTIQNPPVGQSIPIVVQAGKWRKVYSMTVNGCMTNAYNGKLTLPKDSSEGDLPHIAISTGGADSLECLLTRIGVSDSEYVNGWNNGKGHIHVFQGGTVAGNTIGGPTIDNNTPISSAALWDSAAHLTQYDVVLLSCEGGETGGDQPANLETYVAKNGGKVFASHYHYRWFTDTAGPYPSFNLASWNPGLFDTGSITAEVDQKLLTGMPFPKGQIMQKWLSQVGALTNGELPIAGSRNSVTKVNVPSTQWLHAAHDVTTTMNAYPGMPQYFSWDEPIGAGENICGRIVFSDLHVGAASYDYGNLPGASMTNRTGPAVTTGGIAPMGCNHQAKLSPQEDALEFMLFDLSSCLKPTATNPMAPPTAM